MESALALELIQLRDGPMSPMLEQWSDSFAQTQSIVHQLRTEGIRLISQHSHRSKLKLSQSASDSSTTEIDALKVELQVAINAHLVHQSAAYRQSLETALQAGAQLSQQLSEFELDMQSVDSEVAQSPSPSPVPGMTFASFHSQLLMHQFYLSLMYLFELLCLSTDENVTLQLTDWLHRSVPVPDSFAAMQIDGQTALASASDDTDTEDSVPVDSEEWFADLCSTISHGRIDIAIAALTDESSRSSLNGDSAAVILRRTHTEQHLQRVVQLIDEMPTLRPEVDEQSEQSQDRLMQRLNVWRDSVRRLHAELQSVNDESLSSVCLILLGDCSALVNASSSFVELLVAQLLYVSPQSSRDDLPRLVDQSVQLMAQKHAFYSRIDSQPQSVPPFKLNDKDECLRLLLSLQVDLALMRCEQLEPSQPAKCGAHWMLAHVYDLLVHAKAIDAVHVTVHHSVSDTSSSDGQSKIKLDRREYSISQYMNALLPHSRLWRLVPVYARHCTLIGREYMQRLVAQSSLAHAAERVDELLALCVSNDLKRERIELCHARAKQLIHSHMESLMFGQACTYLLKANDLNGEARVKALCTHVLHRIFAVNEAVDQDQSMQPQSMSTLQARDALYDIIDSTSSHTFVMPSTGRLIAFIRTIAQAWDALAQAQDATEQCETLVQDDSSALDAIVEEEVQRIYGEQIKARQQCVQLLMQTLTPTIATCPPQLVLPIIHRILQILPSIEQLHQIDAAAELSMDEESSSAPLMAVDFLQPNQTALLLDQLQTHARSSSNGQSIKANAQQQVDVDLLRRTLIKLQFAQFTQSRASNIEQSSPGVPIQT